MAYTTPISTPDPIQVEISSQGDASIGQGAFTAIPSGSTNGTAIGVKPEGAIGVKIYLSGSDAVTYTIATSAPTGAPSITFAATATAGGPILYEELSNTAQVYITAKTGSPFFRWI